MKRENNFYSQTINTPLIFPQIKSPRKSKIPGEMIQRKEQTKARKRERDEIPPLSHTNLSVHEGDLHRPHHRDSG